MMKGRDLMAERFYRETLCACGHARGVHFETGCGAYAARPCGCPCFTPMRDASEINGYLKLLEWIREQIVRAMALPDIDLTEISPEYRAHIEQCVKVWLASKPQDSKDWPSWTQFKAQGLRPKERPRGGVGYETVTDPITGERRVQFRWVQE